MKRRFSIYIPLSPRCRTISVYYATLHSRLPTSPRDINTSAVPLSLPPEPSCRSLIKGLHLRLFLVFPDSPMRLATTTFVISSLAALFVTSASAAQFPRPNARRVYKTSAARALAARQFKYRRDIVDTCISISGETFAVASNLAEPEAFADLSVCTCLNVLFFLLHRHPHFFSFCCKFRM